MKENYKKKVYDPNYENYYYNNSAGLFISKSNRKNAKTEYFSIHHLINQNENKKISDDRIIQQFINTLDTCINQFIRYGRKMYFSSVVTTHKQVTFINANNNLYHTLEELNHYEERHFYSIEQFINELYRIYSLIYPYHTISKNDIFKNKSINYFINNWYAGR